MKRLFAAFAVVIGLAATTFAEEPTLDLSTLDHDVTIETGTVLHGTLAANVKISIAEDAYVVLSNAVVDGVNDAAYPWAGLTCLGNAHIALHGSNTIHGFEQYHPGIHVPQGSTLTIMDASEYSADYAPGGSLTVRGGGSGSSAYAAGIGAAHNSPCGDITIRSGTVNAYGGQNSAGIGGAYGSACGKIDIRGGEIFASSANSGPGIGAGRNGSCGTVTFEGGTVRAEGGYGSAGIGGPGAPCDGVSVRAGIVSLTAVSGDSSRDAIETIGTTVTVEDGLRDVSGTIAGDRNIRTISRWDGNLSTLDFDDPVAQDGTVIHGTLASFRKISIAADATVTISNATIDVAGSNDPMYPWAGLTCLGHAMIVLEGSSTVKGFYEDYPGIHIPDGMWLTIDGSGSLSASSRGYGAGIGGGYNIGCGWIRIYGGNITAAGGDMCAGIGGGGQAVCGGIEINAGTVDAAGGEYAPGIGIGYCGSGSGHIAIFEDISTVTATCGNNCTVPIGAGYAASWTGEEYVAPYLGDYTSGSTRTISRWNGDLSTVTHDVTAMHGTVIHGTLPGKFKVTIAESAEVTLSNAVINVAGAAGDSTCGWAGLNCLGDAYILLAGSTASTICGFHGNHPGIHVPESCVLYVSGTGSLDARSNGTGAGIGGACGSTCGDIVIEGGTVSASGAGAGIGAGQSGSCGYISISGGDVTASSTGYSAGIGGGGLDSGATCGPIVIDGGTIAATGGTGAAGIGGGNSGSCEGVFIYGGTVTAAGGAAGIGSGSNGNCDTVQIDDGIVRVTATCGQNSEPVGAGAGGTCGTVAIDSSLYDTTSADGLTRTIVPAPVVWDGNLATLTGDVTIDSDMTIYGELAGQYKITVADGVTVTLDNAIITNGGVYESCAGITCEGDAEIVLAPGSVNTVAAFNDNYPGIFVPAGSTLTITGTGTLNATGGMFAAAIGGGGKSDCGNIVIEGGAINAAGGNSAAAIGSGPRGGCDGIEINGGTVTAVGDGGAGIGSGYGGDCGGITINGGNVTATGGTYSAGIGGGNTGSCGDITITGGSITAIGGISAAGIGGGSEADCGAITIGAGIDSVVATCGDYAPGPIGKGGGSEASCGTVAIDPSLADDNGTPTRTIVASTVPPVVWNGNLATLDDDVVAADGTVIYGTLSGNYKVSIAEGATVTISNVVISGENDSDYEWAGINCEGDATILLEDSNYVKGFYEDWPGIFVDAGYTLTIGGSGSLHAESNGWGAGIGGGYIIDGGNIVVESGTIVASGGCAAAGIGGGNDATCGDITILGGNVTASSDEDGAGIGSGLDGESGDITIEGGTVVATGGSNGAGIGSGGGSSTCGICGKITILGGNVTATGGDDAAGIGGGKKSKFGDIDILGGDVTATGGGDYAAGIGGGYRQLSGCGGITIGDDGEIGFIRVVATRAPHCLEAIGAGYEAAEETLVSVASYLDDTTSGYTRTITASTVPPVVWDGNLAALAGDVTIDTDMTIYGELAGQYKISIADGVTVTLDNAVITNGLDNSSYPWAGLTCLGDAEIVLANGSENFVKGFFNEYPGIYVPENKTLTISGSGSLNASSNGRGAGIGGGYRMDCGDICIEGGAVTATGGNQAPGIGTGSRGQCGDITITGGQVTATGGAYAAGIGTGDYTSSCGDITITGGSVTATGGFNGAGIGSADDSSSCGAITIGAGIGRVVATCGDEDAEPVGKGGGSEASCGTVAIDPGLLDDDGNPVRTIMSTAPVQSETIGGVTWYYRTCGTMCEIYNDGNPAVSPAPSGALEIPATLGGSTVTAIGDFAFVGNAGMTSAVIPAGVKSIGQSAFYACTSLSSVTIPRSVVSIGNHAFGYSGLETAYVARGRTNAIKEMLIASGHETAFVDGITFVEPVWDGNLATLDEDIVVDRDMTIYGELAGLYRISIADNVTVTLDNAVITNGESVAEDEDYSWAGITCEGDATIILAPGSVNETVGFHEDYPGIYVPAGSTLTIRGTGALYARSSVGYNGLMWACGIGGGYDIDCGNIVIEGGTIYAIGGNTAAAIGGGWEAACGDITITGGDITATGGPYAAGIGCGYSYYSAGTGSCGAITIGAGVVRIVATAIVDNSDGEPISDNDRGAPIGAGGNGGICGTISIDPGLTDDNGFPVRTITGSGFAGYVAWASENGVTGGWSAVDANGIANVFRYVFNKATGDFAVILGIEFNAEGKAVIKTPPVVNEAGFTLSIKASDDLDGTGNTATYGLNPTGETLIDEATSAKRFFRLRAERN